MREVLDGDIGMHLPEPTVLRCKDPRGAASKALGRENRLVDALSSATAGEQRGRTRAQRAERVDHGERRQRIPFVYGGRIIGAETQCRERETRRGGPHTQLARCRVFSARCTVERDRQHLRQRRAAIAALGERRAATQRHEPTAALAHELREHAKLVGREERRFDAAKDQPAIREELFTTGRESTGEFEGVAHAEAQELLLGAAQQRDELQRAVGRDRAAHEAELGTRLPFHIEDAIGASAHLDDAVRLVVLGDRLAVDRRGAHGDAMRARREHGEAQTRAHRLLARRQRDDLGRHDAAVGLGGERHAFAGHAAQSQCDVSEETRACERAHRKLHALDRDIAREPFDAGADRVDRDATRFQREHHWVQFTSSVVGTVGDDDESGERCARQFLARAVERSREVGARPESAEPRRRARGPHIGGESIEAQREAVGERAHECRGIGEGPLGQHGPRVGASIAKRHRTRVVEQHREYVPLRHRARDDERRTGEAGDDDQQCRESQGAERDAVRT